MKSPAGLSVHPSLLSSSETSYINGVVPFVVDLFPTSWASISIL